MKELFDKIKFKCQFQEHGCYQLSNYSSLKSHILKCKTCPFCKSDKYDNHDELKCVHKRIDLIIN